MVVGGRVVGCQSACSKFQTDAYCCRGAFASGPAACPPTSYSQTFKSACPAAYSYAYDDATSTFTCLNSKAPEGYEVTFCG